MGHGSEFEKASPLIVDAVKAGATINEAAQQAEITERTVKRWLTEGRRDSSSPYANFAFAIDFMREHRATVGRSEDPVDDAEVQLHLSRAIRSGSVQAMKVWTDTYRKSVDPGDEKSKERSVIDELAERREQVAPAHSAAEAQAHR